MKAIGDVAQGLLSPLFRHKPHMALMMDWGRIMPQEIHQRTWPVKLVPMGHHGAVLYMAIAPQDSLWGWSVTPQILQHVNIYLGGKGVRHIRWVPMASLSDAEKALH